MFFEGYIAAPPTILVISFAKVGTAASEPRLSASAAPVAKAAIRIFFIGQLRLLCFTSHCGDERSYGAGADADAGTDQRFSSLPEAITGPVGWSVGEPPAGSSETASIELRVASDERAAGTARVT